MPLDQIKSAVVNGLNDNPAEMQNDIIAALNAKIQDALEARKREMASTLLSLEKERLGDNEDEEQTTDDVGETEGEGDVSVSDDEEEVNTEEDELEIENQ